MVNGGGLEFGLLLGFAFLPPIVYVIWFRNTERQEREPWGQVFRSFGWGAVIGVVVAVVLSLILAALIVEGGVGFLREFYTELDRAIEDRIDLPLLLLIVVVAPLAEEAAKGLGVLRVRRSINEMEDGIVYGAAAGLGFAATENLLYGAVAAATQGLEASLVLIGVRSFSSALLHASASAAFGYGVARSRLVAGKGLLPLYLLAVFMHGSYNFFAGLGEIFRDALGDTAAFLGFVAAVVIALLAVGLSRSAITRQERRLRPGPPGAS